MYLNSWLLRIFDFFMPFCSFFLASNSFVNLNFLLLLTYSLFFVVISQFLGLYREWVGKSQVLNFFKIATCWTFVWLFITSNLIYINVILIDDLYLRSLFNIWFFYSLLYLFLIRIIFFILNKILVKISFFKTNIILCGSNSFLENLISDIENNSLGGLNIIGYMDDTKSQEKFISNKYKYLGSIDDLLQILNEIGGNVDEIYVSMNISTPRSLDKILNDLTFTPYKVKVIPDINQGYLMNSQLGFIGNVPILSIFDTPLSNLTYRFVKRLFDIFLSLIFLIILSPVFILTAVSILISSGTPILFIQKRISYANKKFSMYKFRTMDTKTPHQATWKRKGKPVTRIGKFLRTYSLDELPQIFNVLKGDMSLVGPRPEVDIFVEKFANKIPRYMQKHMVKAGMTGLAQVNGMRGDTSLEKRIEYDLLYIANWSIMMDLKILVKTFFKIKSPN